MRLDDAKILFVDDEPLLLEIFSKWLAEDESDRISTAPDGQVALAMIAQNTYDLLITDVNMPRLNGVELVRSIATMGRTLPGIIFVSGFGNVNEREMYGLGVEAFLAKPVTRDALIATAERALAQRSLLWQSPMDTPPRQTLSIEAADICEDALSGGIAVGRGGFSAPYSSPVGAGRVSFDCFLSARETRIVGEGYVRWRAKAEGTIGVEFAYLHESCRAAIAAEIAKANPRAFIPAR
jgi:CheY-like chemotaxis protein